MQAFNEFAAMQYAFEKSLRENILSQDFLTNGGNQTVENPGDEQRALENLRQSLLMLNFKEDATVSNFEPNKSPGSLRQKRRRQNRKLRKLLAPKNTVETFQELEGINKDNMDADNGFINLVTDDSVRNEGKGQTLMAAKQNAWESPFCGFVPQYECLTNGYNQAVENNADEQRFFVNLGQSLPMENFKEEPTAEQEANATASNFEPKKSVTALRMKCLLGPKNAVECLQELKGLNKDSFVNTMKVDGGFKALVNVDSVLYVGKGQTVIAAKQNACEKAFRALILNHEYFTNGENQTVENPADEQRVLANLTSFAVHKLLGEWNLLVDTPADNASDQQSKHCASEAPNRNGLPDNMETIHPVTLLCRMLPNLRFMDFNRCGNEQDYFKHQGVLIGNNHFVAYGRSKKIARYNLAVNVCNDLFGTNFLYKSD